MDHYELLIMKLILRSKISIYIADASIKMRIKFQDFSLSAQSPKAMYPRAHRQAGTYTRHSRVSDEGVCRHTIGDFQYAVYSCRGWQIRKPCISSRQYTGNSSRQTSVQNKDAYWYSIGTMGYLGFLCLIRNRRETRVLCTWFG